MKLQASTPQRLLAALLAVGLLGLPVQAASVGAGWEPQPLVDPNAVSPQIAAPTAQPAGGIPQANLEEALKPVLPFIESVEKRLFIRPTPGQPLSVRLNHLQQVLLGEQKYQDAGPLIAKMAELFPQEAAQAEEQLRQQMASQLPQESKKAKPTVSMPVEESYAMPAVPDVAPPQQVASTPFPSRYKMLNQQFGSGAPERGVDWDRFDDDWDSSFSDRSSTSAAPAPRAYPEPDRGSTVKAVGQGLLGLAGIAGALAGGYYLNKKMGGSGMGPRYNDPYYGNPYGNPYYASPYNAPYYGNQVYGNPYGYPPGTYYQPYRGRTITRPYTGMAGAPIGAMRSRTVLPF